MAKHDKKKEPTVAKTEETKTPPAAAAAPETTALETKGETAIAEWDFGDSAGAGRETITKAMIKIPIFRLIQKMTPGVDDPEVCKKFGPLFKPGNFQNPVTGKCYDGKTGVLVQMCALTNPWLEWEPDQGGLVDKHESDSEVVKEAKRRVKAEGKKFNETTTPAGNDLVEYLEALSRIEDPVSHDVFMAQVSVKSTGIPTFQNYVSTITSNAMLPNGAVVDPNKIPLFSYVGLLTSEFHKDDKYTWYQPVLAPAKGDASKSMVPRSSDAFKQAEGLYKAYAGGEVVVDDETRDAGGKARNDEGNGNSTGYTKNRGPDAGDPDVKF